MSYIQIKTETPQGWECPKCGRVFAPFVNMCPYCGDAVKTVVGTGITETIDTLYSHSPNVIQITGEGEGVFILKDK